MRVERLGGRRFEVLAARWIKLRGLRPTSAKTYLGALRQFHRWAGEPELHQVAQADIERWIGEMPPVTARWRFAIVRGFFRWLVEDEQLDTDPTADVVPPPAPPRTPAPKADPERLRQAMEGRTYRRPQLAAVPSEEDEDMARRMYAAMMSVDYLGERVHDDQDGAGDEEGDG